MTYPGAFVTGSLEYLQRPFVRNIKPGQKVLILSDTAHDPRVWRAVMSICQELGADTTLALFERRPADYYDPPEAVCEAMMKSDAASTRPTLKRFASICASKQVVPVGCAIGAMIAGYAARYGAAAAALVLSNAAARSSPAAKAMLTERAAIVRQGGMAAILPQALDRGFVEQPCDARYRRYYDAFAAQPAEHYVLAALASVDYDVGDELPRIACPALVVAGGHDILLPPALSREVAALVPGARFEMLNEAGHYAPYQSPRRFRDLVLGFLAELPLAPSVYPG